MYNDTDSFFASSSIVPAILSALYLWSAYSLIFLADSAFRSVYMYVIVASYMHTDLWRTAH